MEFTETAIESGYKDMNHVRFKRSYMENRAIIGCEQEGRLQAFGKNNPSVSDHGYEISDEILTWIKMEICVGPLSEEELPFKDYTVSSLTTLLEPIVQSVKEWKSIWLKRLIKKKLYLVKRMGLN